MGSKPAPSYANNFMARRIDNQILEIAEKYIEGGQIPIRFMKRFLDDIFQIFQGATKKLHQLFDEINTIHPNVKFTMSQTSLPEESEESRCSCPPQESIPFLDTSCKIKNGKIEFDLHRKCFLVLGVK